MSLASSFVKAFFSHMHCEETYILFSYISLDRQYIYLLYTFFYQFWLSQFPPLLSLETEQSEYLITVPQSTAAAILTWTRRQSSSLNKHQFLYYPKASTRTHLLIQLYPDIFAVIKDCRVWMALVSLSPRCALQRWGGGVSKKRFQRFNQVQNIVQYYVSIILGE